MDFVGKESVKSDSIEVSQEKIITIAATFVIDSLKPSLEYMLEKLGFDLSVQVAPYHQVFQQLLDPSSNLNQNQLGINVLAIRLEDYLRDIPVEEDAIKKAEIISYELIDAIKQFLKNTQSTSILMMLPASARLPIEQVECINQLTKDIEVALQSISGLVLVTDEDLNKSSFNILSDCDEVSDELAHVPFSERGFASLSLVMSRKIHMLMRPARKVLVLDCDNTIWRGVVGEDGVEGIAISSAFLEVQKFAVKLQSQGVLICLASKNVEQDVEDVFLKRGDMVLKMEHIVAHRINWEAKYQNLQSLAKELNLGLDSFVFIDDNPVECGQMRATLPQVVTLQLPHENEILRFLNNIWMFDKLKITEEDSKRTQMYFENRARQNLELSSTNINDFLSSLALNISIEVPSESDWARVAQLTQRTNQFNFTTIRRNEHEMKSLVSSADYSIFKVNVSDRFGDYGLVGVVVAFVNKSVLVVDTFLLSCRVLGRGVEHAILRFLSDVANSSGCEMIKLTYVPTEKNAPALAFADSVASSFRNVESLNVIYEIPCLEASIIRHIPGADPEAILEAKRADGKKNKSEKTELRLNTPWSECYEKIVEVASDGKSILSAMRQEVMRHRSLDTPSVTAETDLERELLLIWEENLGMKNLGVEDNYFALGGTSLLSARLFSEIAKQYNLRLRLTTILEAPTIRSLAKYIQPNQVAGNKVLIQLKPGHEKILFLVHDGDGETLLYRNLANHMPSNMAVIGIGPKSTLNVPMAHTSINQMAAFYVDAIKEMQKQGPYLLGGMCAGGLIAYEMATQLIQAGDQVEMVAILDAATPLAGKHKGLVIKARANRMTEIIKSAKEMNLNLIDQWICIARAFLKKLFNVLNWELSSRYAVLHTKCRFLLLKHVLSNNQIWPKWVKELSVREIYTSAEVDCQLLSDPRINVLLARAKNGEGDDKPYREVYADDTFGWSVVAPQLTVVDVEGGHASMLQEPYVKSLADNIKKYLHIQDV